MTATAAAAWSSLRVMQLSASLTEVEELVDRPPVAVTDEIARALSRFLVVRACGYLEQVVEECCKTYAQAHSDLRVSNYASASWRRGFNPTPKALTELVVRFDALWADELRALLDRDDERLSRRCVKSHRNVLETDWCSRVACEGHHWCHLTGHRRVCSAQRER